MVEKLLVNERICIKIGYYIIKKRKIFHKAILLFLIVWYIQRLDKYVTLYIVSFYVNW